MKVTLIIGRAAPAAVMSFCHFTRLNPCPFIARPVLPAERFSRLAGNPEAGYHIRCLALGNGTGASWRAGRQPFRILIVLNGTPLCDQLWQVLPLRVFPKDTA